MAPFFKVGFADFWLAEQLTSMAPVLIDFYTFVRFYCYDAEDWTNDECKSTLTQYKFLGKNSFYQNWKQKKIKK